ncbi:hypothetical protein TNCV_1826351 [Trichonephila clavipes]|nr:hypothetical protein TNCV_1826351 [Trichonephila clavipes]
MYGATNDNGRAALWLYQERFPSRRTSNHKMFQWQLCENGAFSASTDGRGRSMCVCVCVTVRQNILEEIILDHVDKTPGRKIQWLYHVVYISVTQSLGEFCCCNVGVDTISKTLLTLYGITR